jgi:Amt family ammonium transporter
MTGVATGNGLFFGGGFKLLGIQAMGSAAVIAFTLVISLIFWSVIKAAMGLRVASKEEINGLDMGEHGMEAYAGFQMSTGDYAFMKAEGQALSAAQGELAKAKGKG